MNAITRIIMLTPMHAKSVGNIPMDSIVDDEELQEVSFLSTIKLFKNISFLMFAFRAQYRRPTNDNRKVYPHTYLFPI